MNNLDDVTKPLMQNKPSYTDPRGATGSDGTNGESDPMIKDRKSLELSGADAIIPFLVSAFVALPIWIVLILPVTLIYQSFLYICKVSASAVGIKKKSKKTDAFPSSVTASANVVQKKGDREHDLVIFGASGFTGQMAAVYIAKQYGDKFKWAIAGRRMSALLELRSKLSAIDPTLKDLPIIIADTSNIPELEAMVKKSKVIISTAGQFSVCSSPSVYPMPLIFCLMRLIFFCDPAQVICYSARTFPTEYPSLHDHNTCDNFNVLIHIHNNYINLNRTIC